MDRNPVVLLISPRALARCAAGIEAALGGRPWRALDGLSRLNESQIAQVSAAYFTRDVLKSAPATGEAVRSFFSMVEQAPGLRWLHIFSAGAERPVYQRLRERGVAVTTSSGASAPFVALTAITGMLMLARGFPRWVAAQARKEWLAPMEPPPADLRGSRCLVIGTGPIGQEIARLCGAIGISCIGVRRHPQPLPPFASTIGYDRVREALGEVRAVFVACPLSEQTRHLLDERAWAAASPGLHVINVARGAVIHEASLIEALRAGRVGGAYLDVMAQEPLSPDSPLWEMPNVILSPHGASESAAHENEVDRIFLENLRRWAAEQSLLNALGN